MIVPILVFSTAEFRFHALVGAAPDAEDLASQVSTEAQDGARSVNLGTVCLLVKEFLEQDFSLRSIDPRRIGLEEPETAIYTISSR